MDRGVTSGLQLGVPPATVGGVLSRPDTYPARSSGRFPAQSGASEHLGVRLRHRRHAPFAARRSPSVRATPPTYAGSLCGHEGRPIAFAGGLRRARLRFCPVMWAAGTWSSIRGQCVHLG